MPPHLRRLGLVLIVSCVSAGCGAPRNDATTGGPAVPPAAVARDGLIRALQGWRDNQPADPHLGLVDSDRIAERRLEGFEVLGPVELGVGRGFNVRLSLAPRREDDEPEERITRFVVFGIDPLWVFRLEDYERISHWEHKMEPDPDDPGA